MLQEKAITNANIKSIRAPTRSLSNVQLINQASTKHKIQQNHRLFVQLQYQLKVLQEVQLRVQQEIRHHHQQEVLKVPTNKPTGSNKTTNTFTEARPNKSTNNFFQSTIQYSHTFADKTFFTTTNYDSNCSTHIRSSNHCSNHCQYDLWLRRCVIKFTQKVNMIVLKLYVFFNLGPVLNLNNQFSSILVILNNQVSYQATLISKLKLLFIVCSRLTLTLSNSSDISTTKNFQQLKFLWQKYKISAFKWD